MANSKVAQDCESSKIKEAQGSRGGPTITSDFSVRGGKKLPITEISDKDYRSICWPCDALEENTDDKPEG